MTTGAEEIHFRRKMRRDGLVGHVLLGHLLPGCPPGVARHVWPPPHLRLGTPGATLRLGRRQMEHGVDVWVTGMAPWLPHLGESSDRGASRTSGSRRDTPNPRSEMAGGGSDPQRHCAAWDTSAKSLVVPTSTNVFLTP